MAKKFLPDIDARTTAQGLFLSADAYLEAAEILLKAESREGHAAMPIRFLLFHAAELFLKAFLRVAGEGVPAMESYGHRFDRLFDRAIDLGFRPAAVDYFSLVSEQSNDQVIRSRYLVTGSQKQVPLMDLLAVVMGLRKDLRHHSFIAENLIFRPWDVVDGNIDRVDLPRFEPIEE